MVLDNRSKGRFGGELVGGLGVAAKGMKRLVTGQRHDVVRIHAFKDQISGIGVAELVGMKLKADDPPDRTHELLDAVIAEPLAIVLVGVGDEERTRRVSEVFASIAPKSQIVIDPTLAISIDRHNARTVCLSFANRDSFAVIVA